MPYNGLFLLNFKSAEVEPIYIQIKNQIIQMIADKSLAEGDMLPSVRTLASYLNVNMHTVNKSYSLLKNEGFIRIEPGRGAFVNMNLNSSTPKFKNSLRDFINSINAECKLRDISKDEFLKIVSEEFLAN